MTIFSRIMAWLKGGDSPSSGPSSAGPVVPSVPAASIIPVYGAHDAPTGPVAVQPSVADDTVADKAAASAAAKKARKVRDPNAPPKVRKPRKTKKADDAAA